MNPIQSIAPAALLAALCLAAMPAAHAAGSVEYEVRSEEGLAKMAIEWLDKRHMRMDMALAEMPANMKAWQVMRDGKVYAVNIQDGQTMVVDMGAMMKMMGKLAGPQGGDALGDVAEFHSLQPTGRSETVAGVTGQVFLLDYRPGEGQRQQVEVVLSNQRTVREMTEALMAYGQALSAASGRADPAGSRQLESEIQQRQMGLLRFGTQMKAVRISSQAPVAQRLALPAEPMGLPNMAGLPGMGGGQAPAGSAAQREAERQADRQKGRVAERAQAEADGAVDKAVDNVLGKALDKLFGR